MRASGGSPTTTSSATRHWHGRTSTGLRLTLACIMRPSQGELGQSQDVVFASRMNTELPTVLGIRIALSVYMKKRDVGMAKHFSKKYGNKG